VNVLDLFSGIGGFSLGLERAGFRTVAFCEIEPYARAVLAERWPGVPIFPDVRELSAASLAAAGIRVDVICGGFPCQDISVAGRRVGIEGERSGLWSEFARVEWLMGYPLGWTACAAWETRSSRRSRKSSGGQS
jgi:DNA (cytosine-5)-methyltransferase 1